MPTLRLLALALALLASSLPAQLNPGDIGVTWLSTSSFSVLRAAGGSTVFNIGSFQGTGNTSTILLDPTTPDSFLIAGGGFIGRATITGSSAAYTLLTGAAGLSVQLGYDGATFVSADFDSDQLLRFDPESGAVTPITSGPQPWGADLNACTIDPSTGVIYAGGNGGLWEVPPGSATPQLRATGWQGASVSAFVTGIAIDPLSFEPVLTILTVNRVVRVSSSGTLTNLVNPGAIPGPNAIDVDENGDFIVGASFGQIYRVPRAGGTPILLGTAGGVIGAATGVARVQSNFRSYLTPTGSGSAHLALRSMPAGSLGGWTVASLDLSAPPGGGPVFGITPDAFTFQIITANPAATPGNPFHFTLPVSAPLYPTSALFFPTLTFPPGSGLDVLGVATLPNGQFSVTPPRRSLH